MDYELGKGIAQFVDGRTERKIVGFYIVSTCGHPQSNKNVHNRSVVDLHITSLQLQPGSWVVGAGRERLKTGPQYCQANIVASRLLGGFALFQLPR
jgi:hypothetical protein